MSALYGFDLIFPRSAIRTALENLARRAQTEDVKGSSVHFPGEAPLQVPFDGDSEAGPTDLIDLAQAEPLAWLHATLWLPVDDRVRNYLTSAHPETALRKIQSGSEEAAIGSISVFIHLGARYGILSLGAVTSSMSYMFEESLAVRSTVLLLLEESGGLLAVLSRHPGEPCEFLDNPGVQLPLGRYDGEVQESVDEFAEQALAASKLTERG